MFEFWFLPFLIAGFAVQKRTCSLFPTNLKKDNDVTCAIFLFLARTENHNLSIELITMNLRVTFDVIAVRVFFYLNCR